MASCGEVKKGDSVLYEGRRHLVCGFTMKSSATQYVDLEDEASGQRLTVPFAEVETAKETGYEPDSGIDRASDPDSSDNSRRDP